MPEGTEEYAQYTEFPYGTDDLMNPPDPARIPELQKIMMARCGAQYSLLQVLIEDGLLKAPERDGRCHGCSGTCCTGVGSDPCTC